MLNLTFAANDYDRTAPIRDGRVRPQGINLRSLILEPEELFFRTSRYQDIDVSEMSLSSYVLAVSRGNAPFIAIPAFLSRVFRHGNILVRADSGITKPEQLAGKRIGLPEFQMTAPVWQRGILTDEYGINIADVKWVSGGLEEPGRDERIPWTPPARTGISIEIEKEKTLTDMLINGELDALIVARNPSAFDKGHPQIKRLFPNYREVEKEYFKRTGIFPIMHLVVIKREIYDEHPWIAPELLKAFEEAKKIAINNLFETAAIKTVLPWVVPEAEEEREFFNGNIWPYGVEANRKALETFLDYHYRDGLSERRVTVEEIFAPNTLEISSI